MINFCPPGAPITARRALENVLRSPGVQQVQAGRFLYSRPTLPSGPGPGPARPPRPAPRTGRGPPPGPRPPGQAGEMAAVAQRFRVFGAKDPLVDRDQRRKQVAGLARIPRLTGPTGKLARARSVSGSSGPKTRSSTGTSAANRSRALAASPACPVHRARLPRPTSVSGCSGPDTRAEAPAAGDPWRPGNSPCTRGRRRFSTCSCCPRRGQPGRGAAATRTRPSYRGTAGERATRRRSPLRRPAATRWPARRASGQS